MQLRAEEISQIIKKQIQNIDKAAQVTETGTVLMVGDGIARVHGLSRAMAGEMVELAAAHFAGRKPLSMTVANRRLERGERLAARFGARTLRLADLPSQLHTFDAVVSCTASTIHERHTGRVEQEALTNVATASTAILTIDGVNLTI